MAASGETVRVRRTRAIDPPDAPLADPMLHRSTHEPIAHPQPLISNTVPITTSPTPTDSIGLEYCENNRRDNA